MLLALLMIFTSVPLPVFAAEEPVCAAHTEHDAACGYADAVAGTPCTHVCGENCPVKEVTVCVHDHTASGCTYTEPKEAVYCGHACNTGTCGYKPEVPGVDCTCGAESHTEDCGYAEGQAEVPCDFVHDGCGCSEAVTGGWSCDHVCSVESGCITQVCIHTCPNDGCGYTAPKAAAPCTHTCAVCELQKLIDALPAEVTAENLDAVGAQLTAIDKAKLKLTDEQLELVDFTRYQEAVSAISTLSGQPAADEPEMADIVTGKCGDNATWSYNPSTQLLTISGTGAVAIYADGEEQGVILSGGEVHGVTAAVEIKNGSVIFSKAVNDLSDSAGPMILLHQDTVIGVQTYMNASTGYTVKLATESGIGRIGNSLDAFHVDGCFAAYENGLYVEYTNGSLYLRKETKPNGSIDYYNEKIVGLKPNTVYRVSSYDYDIFTDDTGALTIYEEWMGTEITITEPYVSGARPQSLAIPERPAYPTGISIQNESTVGKNDGALIGVNPALEYRQDLVSVPSPWVKITGTSLENLAPGSYSVRVAATDSSFAGHTMGYGIWRGRYTSDSFGVSVPADTPYDATAKFATVEHPSYVEIQNYWVHYSNEDGPVGAPLDVGNYTFAVRVFDPIHGEYTVTDQRWTFRITKRQVEILSEKAPDHYLTVKPLRLTRSFL